MKLSIVLPTYNRLERLKKVLRALEQQTFPREQFEVVVVSDGSEDGTNEWLLSAETSLNLRPHLQPNSGVAAARNSGVAQTSGDVVLFIDDDVVPAPNLIEEHLKHHTADNIVVLGPMLSPPDFDMNPWVEWEQAMLMKQYNDMLQGKWTPTARQFYTGNTSLRRQHIIDAGGFDPAFRRAEDVELAYRLHDRGLQFVFNFEAVGWHYAERSFHSWSAIPYAYGRNDVIFWRERGQKWLLPTIWKEFHGRHWLIRNLARVCLDRRRLSAVVLALFRFAGFAGDALHVGAIARMAYSGIFNLRHYQGVTDQLGGRRLFFAGVNSSHQYDDAW